MIAHMMRVKDVWCCYNKLCSTAWECWKLRVQRYPVCLFYAVYGTLRYQVGLGNVMLLPKSPLLAAHLAVAPVLAAMSIFCTLPGTCLYTCWRT